MLFSKLAFSKNYFRSIIRVLIRTAILSALIWVKAVSKGYKQTIKLAIGKKRVDLMEKRCKCVSKIWPENSLLLTLFNIVTYAPCSINNLATSDLSSSQAKCLKNVMF